MNIPKHLVLFPDGNSLWAKKNGLSPLAGYQNGYENLINFCKWCKDRDVKILTVFGFTTENWKRNKTVVDFLMNMLENKLSDLVSKYSKSEELQKIGVCVKVIGQKEKLSKFLQKEIAKLEDATKNNKNLFLNLAISYGGKWDILNAVKNIVKEGIPADKIDEKLFEGYLSTAGLPDPDLIIRTGGNMRLSNFALWQSAYSELYFCKKFWPEFTEQDLDEALADFAKRSRHK